MNLDAVPQELKTQPAWVTWRYVEDARHPDKPKKVPFNPRNGKPADTTNAQTWADFTTAVRAARERKHAGVGYVFTADDDTFGGDLDDCIDNGDLAPWARAIVEAMDTYTEISPSGNGVKFFGLGHLSENIKRFGDKIPASIKPAGTPGGIELYSTARYFTVTGQHLAGTPTTLRNVNGALARLVAALAPPEEAAPPPSPRNLTTGDDYLRSWAERVIERAEETLRLAPDGSLHDTRIDMGRLCGGLIPHGLATADDLEQRLYAARVPNAHHTTERRAIRDGLGMGEQKALDLPEPPQQPHFDSEGYAVCPAHHVRLPAAKNGNGYKCHEKDTSTATGWCDFWWKGEGYIPPRASGTTEPVIVAGELITATPSPNVVPVPHYQLYKLSGLRALPPVSWLIDGEVPAGLTTVVCGPSGAGKSFLAVDYALQVALCHPDRAVIYIAPEGGSGYHLRASAWLAHHNVTREPENIMFILQAIPLLTPQAVSEFVATIRSVHPILVIVDTLARCMVGGDENSAKDIGMFFYHTDQIRQETGAAVMIIHHTGKAGSYRGSSALYGAADSWVDVANDDGLITVSCGKAKDWQPFAPRYLRMVETCESVILLPSDQVSQRGAGLTEGQRKTLETLALDIFTGPGAKRSELIGATGIPEPTMYKILSRLKRDGYISQGKRGDPYYITENGMSAIRNYHRDLRRSREQQVIVDPHQNAKLSNYRETISQLSDSDLANYQTIPPPPLGGREIVDSKIESSGDSELFPDDNLTDDLDSILGDDQ